MKLSDLITAVGYRLRKTIGTDPSPTTNEVYQWYAESCEWILTVCAELDSELGRQTGTITTTDGTATYDDLADLNVWIPRKEGWLVKTNSRDIITLTTEADCVNYSPSSSNEGEPEKYYFDANGNVTFLPTPDGTYTVNIPFWWKQTTPTATSFSITGASQADSCVVTAAGHTFQTGDRVYIDSVVGMTQLNGKTYTVTRISSSTFSLDGINSTSYTAYSSGGTAYVMTAFNGFFDKLLISAIARVSQNRDEYNQEYEVAWENFIRDQARKEILMRRNPDHSIKR